MPHTACAAAGGIFIDEASLAAPSAAVSVVSDA